jgi:hypothetical protein
MPSGAILILGYQQSEGVTWSHPFTWVARIFIGLKSDNYLV